VVQVSKSWVAAVDLEVKHLAEGTRLPRDLSTRFLGLRTLDLEYCDHRVPAKELVDALLHLPNIQGLLNVNSLDFMVQLTRRTSLSDRLKVCGPPHPLFVFQHRSCTNVIRDHEL